MHGEFVEGSFPSHQVPLPLAKTDADELQGLQDWLLSYNPRDLFDMDGGVSPFTDVIIPRNVNKRLGQNPLAWRNRDALNVPDWQNFAVPQGTEASSLKTAGSFLNTTFASNSHNLRIFSPDELCSDKLDAVFRTTCRNFQWDQYSRNRGGQVTGILSEHTCQGLLQGYLMTGRSGIFPSYERFLPIVHTMMVQYAKFMKMARETPWCQDLNSLTYIATSTWTRQEHNGLSHQNPGVIGAILELKPSAARVYLPPDPNFFLSTLAHCLRSKNYINLIVASKHPQPTWLSPDEAEGHCCAGDGIWKFASTDNGVDPDVVLVGIGADLMFEVIAAAAYLRRVAPRLAVRVVNVTDLMILGVEGSHPHSLSHEDFDTLFTAHRLIHFNYHGYANELQGLLFSRPGCHRMSIESYQEEGTTTTPFDMIIRNRCSRYHVAEAAVRGGAKSNPHTQLDLPKNVAQVQHDLSKARQHIAEFGEDPFGTYAPPIFTSLHPDHSHHDAHGSACMPPAESNGNTPQQLKHVTFVHSGKGSYSYGTM